MKINTVIKGSLILLLVSLCFFPMSIQAQTQTIKVIRGSASIHIAPDATSTIIGNAPAGSEYKMTNKTGEWFEIEFISRVGVLITGYIHESNIQGVPGDLERKPEFKRVNIRAGGLFYIISSLYDYDHSFPYREETFDVNVNWEPGGMAGFEGGVGFFVVPMLELSASFGLFSKSSAGMLRIDIPNPFDFNKYASDETETDVDMKASFIRFGINFYPLTRGKMRPYFGGGGSYINGKLKMVEGFNYTETIYTDYSHSVSFSKVEYEEKKVAKFGFYVAAGLNYLIINNLSVFLEGSYTLAKDEISDPIYLDQMAEINLSGILAIVGIKFNF